MDNKGEVRKKEFSAFCKFCGQAVAVEAATQEEANQIASLECGCPGSQKEKKRQKMKQAIRDICLNPPEQSGFDAVEEDQYKLLFVLSYYILEGRFEKASVSLPNSTVKISRSKDGLLIFNRSHKVEREAYI